MIVIKSEGSPAPAPCGGTSPWQARRKVSLVNLAPPTHHVPVVIYTRTGQGEGEVGGEKKNKNIYNKDCSRRGK